MKKIVHIDLNAFFIQVESLLNPELNKVPAVVAYNSNRSVISTSNYIARKYGVTSGQPLGIAKSICPSLVVVNPKYHLYVDYSKKFMNYLSSKTKLIEVGSIDEAYLDLTSYLIDNKEKEMLFDMQMEIYRKLNLKCSIGYSYTRFFAKMASDYKKPLGLTIITQDNYSKILYPLSINKVYGLGKKTCQYLEEYGIKTIEDLVNLKDKKIISYFGSRYNDLISCLTGHSSDIVSNEKYVAKSISTERTFSIDEEDFEIISKMFDSCSSELEKQLKKKNELAYGVTIKVRTNDFKTYTKKMLLNKPISSSQLIYIYSLDLFEELKINLPIRLIGIKLDKLINNNDILENTDEENILFK